jgi:hypothetical protein
VGPGPPEAQRRAVLARYTDDPSVIEELLAYNQNTFDFTTVDAGLEFPLDSERHIADWQAYVASAATEGVEAVLRRIFPALLFPVAEGMSQDASLKAARTRGALPEDPDGGSRFIAPERIDFFIHPSQAGEIPVILLPERADFELLVRSVLKKNEPVSIPPSMGASMVAGYNNWDRIAQLRARWEADYKGPEAATDWSAHFRSEVVPNKGAYQDRFILLSRGPYSDVPASALGLDDEEWLDLSTKIRLEHECTHYLTKRALGCMRDNIFDELLADYAGIVAACGEFRSDWFLHFVGLEDEGKYRAGGRLENYVGDPPLSAGAFRVLCELVRGAAGVLEAAKLRSEDGAVLEIGRGTLERVL